MIDDPYHVSQTGFCANLSCVKGQLVALSKRVPLLRFYLRLYPEAQTLIDMCIEGLLIGAQQGRPTVIHAGNMIRFLVLGALRVEKKNEDKSANEAELQEELQSAIWECLYEAANDYAAVPEASISTSLSFSPVRNKSPEAAMMSAELMYHFREKFGDDALLYTLNVISKREFAKVRGFKVTEVEQKCGITQPELKKWYYSKFAENS